MGIWGHGCSSTPGGFECWRARVAHTAQGKGIIVANMAAARACVRDILPFSATHIPANTFSVLHLPLNA
jgi:hypothetical protein